ncbi:MAG: glycosyltransferase [Roseiflexus sp.]
MRILLITYYFPPYNIVASVRTGKTAKYLWRHGHEVRVLTAQRLPFAANLPLEIPSDAVIRTRYIDTCWLSSQVQRMRQQAVFVQAVAQQAQTRRMRWLRQIMIAYRTMCALPDEAIGWYPFALAKARRLWQRWQPDVLLASSAPPTTLLLAYTLHRQYGVPWVGELRDLWTDNHYYPFPLWRKALESWLERRVLQSAAGLVTVSAPLAQTLEWRYRRPVGVVLNGFDPGDYPFHRLPASDAMLRVVYTGVVYPGYQSAAPLFAALRHLGEHAERVRVDFYGNGAGYALTEARDQGVERLVACHGPIPYADALAQQRTADVLLLLLWNDPRERGVYTGKLFEYLGARRPILAIGPEDNVAAALIRERQAGVVSSDPAAIAGHLARWLDAKERGADIPDLPASVAAGLSREEQTRHLEEFLERFVGVTPV